MTQTLPAPLSTAAPPARRGSLRTRILALALLPPLAVGGTGLLLTATQQQAQGRALLVQGASQAAKNFGERVLDLEAVYGLNLSTEALRAGVQERAAELVDTELLPVTDVAVADGEGALVVGHARRAGGDARTVPQWKRAAPDLSRAAAQIAAQALTAKTETALTRRVRVDGRDVTLAAYPLPGRAGVTVLTLDETQLQARVRGALRASLAGLLLALIAATVAASLLASGLITRVLRLTRAAQAVSEGDFETPVPVDGNDELTTLAESVDRLAESSRILLEEPSSARPL